MPHDNRVFSHTAVFRNGWPLAVGVIGIVIGLGASVGLSNYVVYLGMSAVISAIAILGLGVVTGSAGMIALCQLTFAAAGAFIVCWLNSINAPGGFFIWLILSGIGAGIVGIIVGLPALRLRGVNLAVVTLGFAAAADVTLVQIQFPGVTAGTQVLRPSLFASDSSYFFFCVIVLTVCALAVFYLQRGRIGSSWKAVGFSERGTASAGQSVRTAKLSAFAVSAALGGISGGLLAGQVGLPYPSSFSPLQSLALYVLTVMTGAHLIDMAIFGGIVWVLVPEILKDLGIPQDWGFVIFGVLGIQALTSGTNLGETARSVIWRLKAGRKTYVRSEQTVPGVTTANSPPTKHTTVVRREEGTKPLLVVENLTVIFGALTALDHVNMSVFPRTIMGLIGPNGAGKSTFVDALSGFLPDHEGTVFLEGHSLNGLSPHQRARLGLRRTFQQDRVPPTLTVGAYTRFVARARIDSAELAATLTYFGCPSPETRLSTLDVGTRRLVEVAAGVLARPRLLLLDEPAAGLSHEEHRELGARIRELPERFDTSVILIEHDLDLVRSVCPELTVLDFGQVLATGPQETVLENPAVIAAYMGETEVV